MGIDKNRVKTQDELHEPAPIDQVEERVEAKMKRLEGSAKKAVAEGLENDELAEDGKRLQVEGERELSKANKKKT
jgi:uncharacterized protein YjbJ (UPF0337 family)